VLIFWGKYDVCNCRQPVQHIRHSISEDAECSETLTSYGFDCQS